MVWHHSLCQTAVAELWRADELKYMDGGRIGITCASFVGGLEPLRVDDVEIESIAWLVEGERFLVTYKSRNDVSAMGTLYTLNGTHWVFAKELLPKSFPDSPGRGSSVALKWPLSRAPTICLD